jgi:hypothetical protein
MKKQQTDSVIAIRPRYHLWIALIATLSFASCWNNALACGCFDAIWACLFSNANDLTYDLDDDGDGYETPTELQTPVQEATANSVAITIASKEPRASAPQSSSCPKTINVANLIISNINGHIFFTTYRPCETLRKEGEDAPIIPLQLLETDVVTNWYANNCSNPIMNNLIDATIAYIEHNEKNEERATKTAQADAKIAVEKPKLGIFDIDETLLTTNKARLILAQVKGRLTGRQITDILLNNVADNTPVHRLYTYLRSRGYAIAYISGRTEGTREETIAQLQQYGYAVSDDNLFLREEPTDDIATFKANVCKKLASQYKIVAFVDDDHRNLCCGDYRVWIPNILTAQNGEAAFFRLLKQQSVFNQNQSHAKSS